MLRPVLFILILIPTFLRAIDLPDSHETALESEKKGFRFLSSQAHDETFSATSKEAMMRHSAHEMFNAFFLNLLVDGTISPKVHGAFVWNVMGEDLMTNLESDPELKKPENAKIILDALDEVLKENKTKVVREESEGTTGEGKTESSHSGSQLFRTYAYSLGAVFVGEGAIRMGISLKRRFFSNEEQKRIAAEKASNCRRAIKALGTKEKWIARGKALGKRMLAGAFLSIPNYYAPVHSYRKKKWYKDPWSLWPIDGFKNDEPWAFSESFLQEEVRPYLLSLIK